ncbi:hypothetical protein HYT84_03905 [Candidatus Micrarchaeota archaeon]|nr:hypothetical protein [Candidatus Micrarchaeota archaeon]
MFVAVLSDKPELRENFCKLFGTEVSKGDLGLYSDAINPKIWVINPINYPEKIQSLLYTLSMADAVVLIVDGLSPKVGELLVAINSLKLDKGILVSNMPIPVAGTVLEKYEKATTISEAKEKILSLPIGKSEENPIGLIHKTSNLPSLGNVAFGALKGGKIKKHDRLYLLPACKDFDIRSIHVGTNELDELNATSHFEIAYKGDLVERSILVPLRHEFQVENIVNGRFIKSPFFKDELKGKIHAYTNMQYVEGNVTDNDLTLSAPLAFEKGETILVIDASNQKLRVAGVFQSKW